MNKKKSQNWFPQWILNIPQNSSFLQDSIGWPFLRQSSDNETNHEQMLGQSWASIAQLWKKNNHEMLHRVISIHHLTYLHVSSIHCLYNVFRRSSVDLSKHEENGFFVDELPFKTTTHRSWAHLAFSLLSCGLVTSTLHFLSTFHASVSISFCLMTLLLNWTKQKLQILSSNICYYLEWTCSLQRPTNFPFHLLSIVRYIRLPKKKG
jgi:hypothetical protein